MMGKSRIKRMKKNSTKYPKVCNQPCQQSHDSLRLQKVLGILSAGGPFNFVSCPHYLGEIVIYTGLALLAGSELPLTILILCWVVSLLRLTCSTFLAPNAAADNCLLCRPAMSCSTWLQVINLLLAAQPTHLWYKQHFPNYPKERTALIPFVY